MPYSIDSYSTKGYSSNKRQASGTTTDSDASAFAHVDMAFGCESSADQSGGLDDAEVTLGFTCSAALIAGDGSIIEVGVPTVWEEEDPVSGTWSEDSSITGV